MGIKQGKPSLLTEEKVIQFIEEISDLSIEQQIEVIEEKGMEGLPNEYQN